MVRTTLVIYFYVVVATILKLLYKNYCGGIIAELTRHDLTQFVDIFVIIDSSNSEISWINAYLENDLKNELFTR